MSMATMQQNVVPDEAQRHSPTGEQLTKEELSCFSFKKQPIPSRVSCHSAISSFIDPDHSLSNVGLQNKNKTINPELDYQLSYDEQIRAPRMSTLSKTNSIVRILEHEPLGDCDYLHRNSNDSTGANTTNANDQFSNSSRNTSATSSNSMDLLATLKLQNIVEKSLELQDQQQSNQKTYCPAVYDLSQHTRRYSSPCVSSEKPQEKLPHMPGNSNYAEVAKRALLNLQTNTTTMENMRRKDPRERIIADGPVRQIEEPKTPNYIPAVLRPPNFQSSHRKPSFSSSLEAGPDELVGTSPSGSGSGMRSPSQESQLILASNGVTKFMELPRDHWVPNHERLECTACHSKFSIINRKHHCRKCGDIFCFNCCYIRASLNFRLNFDLINGVVVKVCNGCGVQYNRYIRETFASGRGAQKKDKIDDGDFKDRLNGNGELLDRERKGSTQVPIDWNWSSF